MIKLTVIDDGVGFSEMREGSLGLGLVRSLVRQIGGSIDIRGESGVAVTIMFLAS
jgi:two-component sensor histidine kinase